MIPLRFHELLMRWQDGDSTAEEQRELESMLREYPACRRVLATSMLVEAGLHARYGASRKTRRAFPLEAAAAVFAVAAAVFAVSLFLFKSEVPLRVETQPPVLSQPERYVPPPIPPQFRARIEAAKYSLFQAADRAAARSRGLVIAAVLEEDDGRIAFAVKIAEGRKVREIALDPATGEVLEEELEEDEDPSRIVAAAKIPLQFAIWRACERQPGIVLEAEFEIRDGRAVAEVEILSGGRLRQVVVDGVTGSVLQVKP
jgi:uncharacterized membrane protein YkoI